MRIRVQPSCLAALVGKWAVTELPEAGRAGWLSTEVNVQQGLSPVSRTQTPPGNLGTMVNPQATVFGPNGIWVSELAWQQSLADGKLVFLAGQVDRSNYIDANTYANNSQGQFLNSASVNSGVIPFSFNNLGLNLQYQPGGNWYLMFGTGTLNQAPGHSPFAWFGRFGVGGSAVTFDGASAQIATGLAMQAPLQHAGLFPKLSNDYLGAGFVWSKPSAFIQPAAHANEYGLEAMYVLQLTPLASIQPDFQVIWNPANSTAERNFVFQLQMNLTW